MTKNVNKIMALASCGLLLLLTAIVVKLMVGVDSLPVLFFLLCFVMCAAWTAPPGPPSLCRNPVSMS